MNASISDIAGLIERYQIAWQRADAEEAASVFAANATFTSPLFQRYDGRDAIARGQLAAYEGPMAGTTIEIAIDSVQLLRADLAVVHTSSRITRADGTLAFPESHGMLVADGAGGRVEIAAFHNMVPLRGSA